MVPNVSQKIAIFHLKATYEHERIIWILAWFTIFIIYDRLCSPRYTTDLLKDGCFPCISSSYDQDTKMGASKTLPEDFDIFFVGTWG